MSDYIVDLLNNQDDNYESDWALGRVEVGGDAMLLETSVDGQGGELRNLPVLSIEEAAFYLNRGAGPQLFEGVYYNSGANWAGATGTANNDWYFLATSKTNGGEAHDAATAFRLGLPATGPTGPLTQLNYGFYETVATLPDPYVFTRLSDGTSQKYIGDARVNGFSTFSAAQREAARQAIESWDDLIAVTFKETNFKEGDINFMNTTTGPIQASAFLPYGSSTTSVITQDDGTRVTTYERVGDVFINPNQASNFQFDEGQYGLTTLIHEIGHSLGLEHPGAYNFGPGFAVTYENGAEYYQDSAQYSIMSYWDAEETGANRVNWEFLTYNYASTPSVHDVAAIQRIYGADMTTRTGDNVYGFNTTEKAFGSFDFANNKTPVVTIWDAGGNDTLDLSGFVTASIIDLNPGQFSSAGGFFSEEMPTLAEINARRADAGLAPRSQAAYDQYVSLFGETYKNGLLSDNIAIAYGVTIENAIGGSGNDTIVGNAVANKLVGNGGDDTISGGDGLDVVTLGSGNDTFVAEFGATKIATRAGEMSIDIITDFDANGDDFIDVSALGLTFRGTNANKNAGDLTYKVYDSVNGAEKALGFDIDGRSGAAGVGGPVTVVFGNNNGGAADFAIVLLNTRSVDASDFKFNTSSTSQVATSAYTVFNAAAGAASGDGPIQLLNQQMLGNEHWLYA
jgi:serralysin